MIREHRLECDYFVVGAGAASLSFVDTLLSELPETKVILIDKKEGPGGHWINAYGFVRLHQPSRLYGIASAKLEGDSVLPFKHRANKNEILEYFQQFVDTKVASNQLVFFPNCVYDFKSDKSDVQQKNLHYFRSVNGLDLYSVKVKEKLIDGTKGECIIPHDSPLQFPVDDGINVMTPNQIYDIFEGESDENRSRLLNKKFVVLGAGKTGVDSVVYLQRAMNVDPVNIAWVISRDVWMVNSNSKADPNAWARYLANCGNEADAAALALEASGVLVRLDKRFLPSRFRFPVIPPDELQLARNVTTVIRRGRVTAIRRRSSSICVGFGADQPSWEAFAPIESCVFVHATSPGPFNGLDPNTPVFNNPRTMTLQLLLMGPRTFSMSLLAKLEVARRKNRLDIDCMRKLILGGDSNTVEEDLTENDILNTIIQPLSPTIPCRPIMTLAIILATLDRDPLVTIEWMKQNRLCYLSVPGKKTLSCEDIRMLRASGVSLGISESYLSMINILLEKLRPIEEL